MNTVAHTRVSVFAVALLGSFLAANGARAQGSSDPRTASGLQTINGQEIVKVVGHLELSGMRVNQMFVQQRGSKVYLYLHRPTKQVWAVVDVTKPGSPALISREALKGQVEPPATGSVLAITVTPDSANTPASPAPLPTETVQFVDLSNPKNAKSIKSFSGVTSVYPDDSRKLVYVVNNEGLWIVSHRMTHPLPLCNSESALTPEPDCQ